MFHITTTLASLLGPSAIPADNRGREPIVSKSLMRKALALTILVAVVLGAAPIGAGVKFAVFGAFLILVFCGILRVQDCVGRHSARRSPVENPGIEFPRRVAMLAERVAVSMAADHGLASISSVNLYCKLGAPSTLLHTPVRIHLCANGKFTDIELTPAFRAALLSGLGRRQIAYLSLLIGDRLTMAPLPIPSKHAVLAEIARRRTG